MSEGENLIVALTGLLTRAENGWLTPSRSFQCITCKACPWKGAIRNDE